VSSCPMDAPTAAAVLIGGPLTDARIAEAAQRAAVPVRPMDNTDFSLHWRKRVTRDFVMYALCELRGDDMRERRRQMSLQ
jgi:CO/xanthine dehydrogenase FAD-binding subunit